MYEIWFLGRNDWGDLQYFKRLGFKKKLPTAIKIATNLGKNSYVKKYGQSRPVWINNEFFNNMVQNHD